MQNSRRSHLERDVSQEVSTSLGETRHDHLDVAEARVAFRHVALTLRLQQKQVVDEQSQTDSRARPTDLRPHIDVGLEINNDVNDVMLGMDLLHPRNIECIILKNGELFRLKMSRV